MPGAEPVSRGAALLAEMARLRPERGEAEPVRLCRLIGETLHLSRVVLRLSDVNGLAGPVFGWPDTGLPGTGRPGALAGRRILRFPVRLADQPVGDLFVDVGVLHRMDSGRRRILVDVVDLLGPVLDLAFRQQELEAEVAVARGHAERIAGARRQAFAERDQERRELERDLHDGAQHHLVALRMTVGLLELQLAAGDPAEVEQGLARLRSGLEETERTLLTTAAGVCPPVLVDHGLLVALSREFRDDARQVKVLAIPETAHRRFPLAFETAVYFTCLEAVNNARKHAPAAQVTVLLQEDPRGLGFAVADNGPGLSRQDQVDSFGLGNMRARIVAAGGRLELRTQVGAGTRIEGFIPI